MPDLVEWLETAISAVEDHQRRRTVSRFNYGIPCPTCGRENASVIQVTQARDVTLACGCAFEGGQASQLWVTAPTPDAALALRRCAADRKILELHGRMLVGGPNSPFFNPAYVCLSCEPTQFADNAWPCQTMRALAEGYGYQEVAVHD